MDGTATRQRGHRGAVRVAAVLMVLANLTACPGTRGDGDREPGEGAAVTTAVRTDHQPIADRFPKLGEFVEAHWAGGAIGSTDVPGPTDVWIQGLIRLRPEDAAAARAGYRWEPVPVERIRSARQELRPFLPATADWQHSRQYELDVRTGRYSGDVYLEMASGTVFLDLVSA